jgi:NAD-dependent dihydropyrimidine dehydrogenase PreA subunit
VRKDGIFIAVEVSEDAASDAALDAKLAEVCPVDIFEVRDGVLAIVDRNLDECVLCRLCLDASPEGAVKIIKLYDGGAILA